MSARKDYIGRMMAQREGLVDPNRQSVVGLRPVDRADRIRAGAHILKLNDTPSMANDQGYLSSVAFSPMLGHWIALGLVINGRARHGEIVRAWDGLRGTETLCEICDPTHFDRENRRLHG
jgi:sarcosine oxidase subunit alpha